jgi:hypothetical protein
MCLQSRNSIETDDLASVAPYNNGMDRARIFNENGEATWVTAEDVFCERVSRHCEFIDPEYEFKVTFVKASRGHGRPYFRLYLSRDDYKKFSPEQKNRYKILCDMRHYQESPWHRDWEDKFSSFCEIEKTFHEPESKVRKRTDAYCSASETCVEFQHSYINFDFEERNTFYKKIGLNIIWLYDLSRANVKKNADADYEILEDNARGFFRIAEKPENIMRWPVFFQAKDSHIYRVKKLDRKEVDSELKSTIRLFRPDAIYTEEEFIEGIKEGNESFWSDDYKEKKSRGLHTISELWSPKFSYMIVQNTLEEKKSKEFLRINRDNNDNIFRSYEWNCIQYKFVSWNGKNWVVNFDKDYNLKKSDEKDKKWKLVFSSDKK